MIKFLRTNKVAMVILTILRVYLGYQWITSGFEKLTTKGGFNAGGLIGTAINQGTPKSPYAYPWFASFLKATTSNPTTSTVAGKVVHSVSSPFWNFIVPWGEFLIGLGLILGTFTLAAAFFGIAMNFTYLLAGVVSTNPTFILISVLLLMAGFNSGKIGLDYWVTPFLRKIMPFLNNDIQTRALKS